MDLGTEAIFLAFLFVFAIPAAILGGWFMSRIAAGLGWLVLAAFAWGVVCIAGVPLTVWLAEHIGPFGIDPPRYDGAWEAASIYILASGLLSLPLVFLLVALTYISTRPVWWPALVNACIASTLLMLVPWLSWYFIVYRYDPRTCAHECYPEWGPMLVWFIGTIITVMVSIAVTFIGQQASGRRHDHAEVAAP